MNLRMQEHIHCGNDPAAGGEEVPGDLCEQAPQQDQPGGDGAGDTVR